MLEFFLACVHSPAGHGAVTGLFSAAAVDIHSFMTFKKWDDLLVYDWGTATFRWVLGALAGAISGAGYGAMVS